jgi:hypothetical protein
MTKQRLAIDDVQTLLDYRMPASGKPMSSIVLPRELAERLVKEFREQQEVKDADPQS